MAVGKMTALLLAAVTVGNVAAQTLPDFPVLNITKGEPLPVLQQLQPENDWITLNMLPATIQVSNFRKIIDFVRIVNTFVTILVTLAQGPGDNSSLDDPYITYTGRTYNEALIAGMIRVQQGTLG